MLELSHEYGLDMLDSMKKDRKLQKKCFCQLHFFKPWGLWASKEAEFYVDFRNINFRQ
jgi:hypothetical protein